MTAADLPGPLHGLRVLELCDEKGQFCGKLMADLGADVIKVEPLGGQSTRTVGPFLDDVPHRERSLAFWHYNTSKRGITLNPEHNGGQDLFRRLVPRADIVLESYAPGYLPGLGLGYEALSALNPGLIMCSLTPFGQTGPWRDFHTSDLLHLAAGGQMAGSGYDPDDVPDAPPIAPGGGNAWHMGGHYAYMAILAALYYRDMSGEGQYIDVSIHEACALTTESHVTTYNYTGQVVRRHTGRAASPDDSDKAQMATRDGRWITIIRPGFQLTPARLRRMAEDMDSHGMAEDLLHEKYQDTQVIQENLEHIGQVLSNFIAQLPQDEAWQWGQKLGVPWGSVRSLDEIVGDEHLQARGFFTDVEHPELGRSFTYRARS
ncbi:MAG: hypothetical protein ETSY2_49990, partial [Candidatus Entotheonella gemina]